jgi:hypothetical protein
VENEDARHDLLLPIGVEAVVIVGDFIHLNSTFN